MEDRGWQVSIPSAVHRTGFHFRFAVSRGLVCCHSEEPKATRNLSLGLQVKCSKGKAVIEFPVLTGEG
jgi:hypothetical protein